MSTRLTDKQRAAMAIAAAGARSLEVCRAKIRFDAGKWYCPVCDYRPSGYMGGYLPFCETRDGIPAADSDGRCTRNKANGGVL